MSYPHVPFPLNVTLSSPNFQLAPLASNGTAGWAPSCTSPPCASTATWSTGAVNSTLSFSFWGWDVAFDGNVQGDMKIEIIIDGQEVAWNPQSNGALASIQNLDDLYHHNISLKVLEASSDALLSVSQARINASTHTDLMHLSDEWVLDSNDNAFSYTGFVQETSAAGSSSPTNYVSTKAGDTASLQFNGSAVAIYGPCGPSNGLMRITVDGEQTIINASKPIQADDCLLFQTRGIQPLRFYELVVTNEDGRYLAINRMQFIRVLPFTREGNYHTGAGVIVGIVVGVILLIAVSAIGYAVRSRKARTKVNRAFSILCG